MLELYSKADQNRIQKEGLKRALLRHRNLYLRKRFGRQVKDNPFNYRWKKDGRPLVSSGTFARMAYTGQAKTSISKGELKGRLTVPVGHPLPTGSGAAWPKNAKPSPYRNEIQRVVGSITYDEAQDMAAYFGRQIIKIGNQGVAAKRKPRVGPSRKRLTTRQRTRMGGSRPRSS